MENDAYEPIEDRALGLVKGKPHPNALSVFNFERLFQEGVATYGNHKLEFHSEAIQLLIDAREYLKMVVSELAFWQMGQAHLPA